MNLIGRFRSNYFAVKDRATYEEWCLKNGLNLIVHETNPDLVGFVNSENESGIPSTTLEESDDGEDQDIPIDFIGELGTLLAEHHVAVVMEIAYEGYRYLVGTAHAINSSGHRRSIALTDIMALAKTLGQHVTECEY